MRAFGAGRGALAQVFAGAAAAVVLPALLVGALLESIVLAPAIERIAAGYFSLPVATGPLSVALVGATVGVLAALVAGAVARIIERQPIVAGLREE
jgi:hypothetical protein